MAIFRSPTKNPGREVGILFWIDFLSLTSEVVVEDAFRRNSKAVKQIVH